MKFSYAATLLMMHVNCFLFVYGIQCYQCRSDLHANCKYRHPEGYYLVNCEDNFKKLNRKVQANLQLTSNRSLGANAFCRKIYQRLLFTPQETETIIRECAYFHEEKDHCYNSLWPDSQVITCDCSTYGCNIGLSRHKKDHMYIPILYTLSSIFFKILF